MSKRLSFIGAGSMAEGMVRGMIDTGLYPAADICTFDVLPERMALFEEHYGVRGTASTQEAIKGADVIILTALPRNANEIMGHIKEAGSKSQIIVSLLAGITFARMESVAGEGWPLARVMPNALIDVRRGYSALCFNENMADSDKKLVERIFSAVGKTMILEEALLDPFTAFSCFQPEVLYYYLTALIDAGVQSGFSWKQSRDVVVETCIATGQTLEHTGLHPYVLSNTMSSPGGCGIEGLGVLYRSGAHGVVMESIRAALRRITEMSKE